MANNGYIDDLLLIKADLLQITSDLLQIDTDRQHRSISN